jgi:hypothetical protein
MSKLATRWVLIDQTALTVTTDGAGNPANPPVDPNATPLIDPVLVVNKDFRQVGGTVEIRVQIPDYDASTHNTPCSIQVVQIPAGHAIPSSPDVIRESANPGGSLDISDLKNQEVVVVVKNATVGDSQFVTLVGFDGTVA